MFLLNESGGGDRGFSIGVLTMRNVGTLDHADRLTQAKRALEEALRERYAAVSRAELKAMHPMDAYIAYYKKYGDTYHVLPQLESVVKGREIPAVLPPVEAMFMAELKNMLLTAGHDLDRIDQPMALRVSTGEEALATLGGKKVLTVPGDLMITDRSGVLSAILRGADARTAITDRTENVVYAVYAPPGVDQDLLLRHLSDIEAYVRLFAPEALTETKELVKA